MKTYTYSQLSDSEIKALCRRPKMDFRSVFGQVQPILDDVEKNGDRAIREYTRKFDGVYPERLTIDPKSVKADLDPDVKVALDQAMSNITRFHKAQKVVEIEVETQKGVLCKRLAKAIERVGLYIPGGTAPLPSTAMMLCIPAMVAGCKTIVLATPPDKNGNIPESILYIAQKTGVSVIIKAGGVQALAGMAFGTESVPKVDKIFGPGNQYVTAAKMILQNSEAMVSIDMPAGPSEVLVIADESAESEFVAVDLLAQAEHGPDSQSILVATKNVDVATIFKEVDYQLNGLPRKDFASKAIQNSFILVVDDSEEAIQFSNRYAPEHLIINTKDADQLSEKVTNAGSVFIGPWTPESLGDYASGTNHTLPTYGYARMYSGVSLLSFQKFITMQKISKEGIRNLGTTVERLAELEGLDAHKNSVRLRLRRLDE